MLESFTDEDRRTSMTEGTNIFRVLIKALLKAGIITDRTKDVYAAWVDMDELHRESDEVAGYDVAEATVEQLREINSQRRVMSKALRG